MNGTHLIREHVPFSSCYVRAFHTCRPECCYDIELSRNYSQMDGRTAPSPLLEIADGYHLIWSRYLFTK